MNLELYFAPAEPWARAGAKTYWYGERITSHDAYKVT